MLIRNIKKDPRKIIKTIVIFIILRAKRYGEFKETMELFFSFA